MAGVVDELFAPMEVAAMGLIDTPTTLATVILCESILQYLPTCETHNTQYATLRAYGVTNRTLAVHGHLTLDATQVGVDDGGRVQVTTPSLKKVWLPLGSLPKRALNATRDMGSKCFSWPVGSLLRVREGGPLQEVMPLLRGGSRPMNPC